jgi:signal transduction histidine kinase
MMIPGRSLRFRLIVGAAVWVTAALVLCGFILLQLFQSHVQAGTQMMLTTHMEQLAALLQHRADGTLELRGPLSEPRFTKPYSGLYWQASDAAGQVVMRSRSLWDGEISLPRDVLADNEVHRHLVAGPRQEAVMVVERSVAVPGLPNRMRIAVAGAVADTQPLVDSFTRTLVLSLGIIALGLIGAAAIQVLVGLRPLAALRRDLAAIREGDAARLAGPFPEEVAPLARDLNALLDHFDEALTRARTQAGQLAHGLKTPLAILANESDAIARDGQAERSEAIRHQVSAMGRQIDHHLARVRAAAAYGLLGVRCDIADSAAAICRVLARLHAERGLAIDCSVPPGTIFAGESQDFEEILGNLVENACKWAEQRVEVKARREAGMVVVTVDDDGPGVPESWREAAFEPGARLDETKPGSGLGLAIARDLVTLYRGGIQLGRSYLGGLYVELRLPAAADAGRRLTAD